MAKKSKRYQEAAKLIEKGKAYSIEEAVALVKETSKVKFDAAVDVAFRLGVDPRQADQQLRGALVLPNGTGKSKKVLVVTEGPKAQEAKDAGADVVGGKEILEDIKKGWLDFEVMIATPDMMAELGKLGRIAFHSYRSSPYAGRSDRIAVSGPNGSLYRSSVCG